MQNYTKLENKILWIEEKTLNIVLYYINLLLLFFIPFSFGHPQILVGTFVNCVLFYIAFNTNKFKYIPAIFIPGIAVLSRGVIFGPLTNFLIYFLPFIWIGNFLLVIISRKLVIKKSYKFHAIIIAAFIKFVFLYSVAYLLVNNFDFPKPFLKNMGIIQLQTALLGGLIFTVINLAVNKIKDPNKA